MTVTIRYAAGEVEFVLNAENPTERALIESIRDQQPPIYWTNETLGPTPAWCRFAFEIKPGAVEDAKRRVQSAVQKSRAQSNAH